MNLNRVVNPNICGFYRVAVCLVASNRELLNTPSSEKNVSLESSSSDSGFDMFSSNDSTRGTDLSQLLDTESINIELSESITFLPSEIADCCQSTPIVKKKKPLYVSYENGLDSLKSLFGDQFSAHQLDKTFLKHVDRLKSLLQKWSKNNAKSKTKYFHFFSPDNWMKLPAKEKKTHTKLCEKCLIKHHDMQALFPSKSNFYMSETKKNLTHTLNKINVLKDTTNTIYHKMNSIYERNYGVSFGEELTKIKPLNLQKRPSSYENTKRKRDIASNVKSKMEAEMNKTSINRFAYVYFLWNHAKQVCLK